MFLNKIIENAKNVPESIAVEFGDSSINYKNLLAEAKKFAEYLKKHGLQKGHSVIVYHSRNIELITKILGIFIAEGVYIPVDRNFPEGRLQEIAEQLNPFAM
ncbi:MAG: AMP-binding protein [Holosporaceae bacterium]|jgi:acyl-CoA synthetase (AMP-forming)/AMP-acid ligase II|nr:AMP-binding protein [Holosporaceae bacterium]